MISRSCHPTVAANSRTYQLQMISARKGYGCLVRCADHTKVMRRLMPALLIASLTGCGKTGPQLAPVSGTVTFNGKPLARARVVFYPSDGRRTAIGMTDDKGQFSLGTYAIDDGALVGQHEVVVVARGPRRPAPFSKNMPKPPQGFAFTMPGPPLIPKKYFRPETSGITFEVLDQRSNSANFDLQND